MLWHFRITWECKQFSRFIDFFFVFLRTCLKFDASSMEYIEYLCHNYVYLRNHISFWDVLKTNGWFDILILFVKIIRINYSFLLSLFFFFCWFLPDISFIKSTDMSNNDAWISKFYWIKFLFVKIFRAMIKKKNLSIHFVLIKWNFDDRVNDKLFAYLISVCFN